MGDSPATPEIEKLSKELNACEKHELIALIKVNTQDLIELQTKLEWMTKKRWALEMALANISTMNSCFISSSSDETVRGTHGRFAKVVSGSIEEAGGITVYVDWGKNDFSSDIPAFNPKKTLRDGGEL